jgi:hypothetical protein
MASTQLSPLASAVALGLDHIDGVCVTVVALSRLLMKE